MQSRKNHTADEKVEARVWHDTCILYRGGLIFVQLAKKYHPDMNKNDPNCQKQFQEVSEAYEVGACYFFCISDVSDICFNLLTLVEIIP